MAEVGNKRFAESAVRQLWGGSEVLVIERRFSNVIIRDTDVAPTIEAGAGGGG